MKFLFYIAYLHDIVVKAPKHVFEHHSLPFFSVFLSWGLFSYSILPLGGSGHA